MAKRLTEKQKEEIIQGFQKGKTIQFLSQKFDFNKLTIVRNLKRSLGDAKYKEFLSKNKSLNLLSDDEEINLKKKSIFGLENVNSRDDLFEGKTTNTKIETEFSPDSSFFEITPLDCVIDNAAQKDLSSIPISDMKFPKTVYMIVNRKIELETKYLKDYPDWQFLSKEELNRKTIEIFMDLKIARRFCTKEQKIIKVPNPRIFKIVAPILISRGISRIVSNNKLISL